MKGALRTKKAGPMDTMEPDCVTGASSSHLREVARRVIHAILSALSRLGEVD
jgi:hypothetical protein